jgi:vacuolar protein sorting-associated protein 8
MSPPSPEIDEGDGIVNMDNDAPNQSTAGEQSSSDDETIHGDPAQEDIAEVLEQVNLVDEAESDAAPEAGSNRYRQLLHDKDDVSEGGSNEGLPRRARSPMDDSVLSGPDDSPSVQVWRTLHDRWRQYGRLTCDA